jgi:hypothetical protein
MLIKVFPDKAPFRGQACLTRQLTVIAQRVRSDLGCSTRGEESTYDISSARPT